jgi:hypothetical protein
MAYEGYASEVDAAGGTRQSCQGHVDGEAVEGIAGSDESPAAVGMARDTIVVDMGSAGDGTAVEDSTPGGDSTRVGSAAALDGSFGRGHYCRDQVS